MAALRNMDVYRHIEHVLAGDLGEEIQPFDVLAYAADWVSGAHSWRFLRPRMTKMDLRGKISIAAATYTHATRNLNLTGGFANYDFIDGDILEAAGGTGVVIRDYVVESRTDDDNIVLASPGLGSDADASADISGTLRLDSVRLPSDFMHALALSSTDSLINGIQWTTPEDLLRKRTTQIDVSSSWQYYGTFTWARDSDGAYGPILDIWPSPASADVDAFSLFYRRRIVLDDEDTGVIGLPADRPLLKLVLIRVARMIAMGFEQGDEPDNPSMDVALDEFMRGPIWKGALKQDGLEQPHMGVLKGGATQRMPRGYRKLLQSEVDAPT